jgi:hypothetical protein
VLADDVLREPDLEPAHDLRMLRGDRERVLRDEGVRVQQLAEPEVDQAEHRDVEEAQDAHPARLDHELAEGLEGRGACGARVGGGDHTAAQMGLDRVGPDLGHVLEDVGVSLDQAGQHEPAGAVDGLHRGAGELLGDRADPAVGHGHVEPAVDSGGRIQHPPAGEQQVDGSVDRDGRTGPGGNGHVGVLRIY